MKIVITHKSPDIDAITSVWLIKRFLQNWADADVKFVQAGERFSGLYKNQDDPIDLYNDDEVIHVDTGLGSLDHHQTQDSNVCAASRTFEYVLQNEQELAENEIKIKALKKIVHFAINEDHFQEIFYSQNESDLYDFSIERMVDGFKIIHPQEDSLLMQFGMQCLDALLHVFERNLWAEKEIAEKGIEFKTKYGKAIGIETVNESVLSVAQKMGYEIVIRKDPNEGYVRIKAKPEKRKSSTKELDPSVDLTYVYELLKKLDPEANWYLHVSKKMLLNGSSKNKNMKATKLPLEKVIEAVKQV